MDHILNKPYSNGVSLGEKILHLEFYPTFEQKVRHWQVLDLSKEVLWISVGQRATKLRSVKL